MKTWLGFDSNCYTGADCWNYNHLDRGLLIVAILTGITIILSLVNKHLK